LDLNDGNYQLNVSVEDISITYNITCSGLCYPVTQARIDIDRIDYQGDFSLDGPYPECTYFLETYDGETTLTGVEVDTGDPIVDTLINLYIDLIVDPILEELTSYLDDFFISTIEGAL
jgi:hypothetical protein